MGMSVCVSVSRMELCTSRWVLIELLHTGIGRLEDAQGGDAAELPELV